jgi:hypothetical protein
LKWLEVEERGVIGREEGRVASDNRCYSGMALEFPVDKLSDTSPVPTKGVFKVCIKGKVALVKLIFWMAGGFLSR